MLNDTNKRATGTDFLVFINFSKTSYNALNYAISLVKATRGSIELQYIINPSEIKDSENNFVVVRSINELKQKAKIKLNSIVEMLELENIEVISSYSIGNLKSEFIRILADNNSKTVVIGKKKSGVSSKVLNTLIHQFHGNVLIVNDDAEYQGTHKIAVGLDGLIKHQGGLIFISNLCKATNMPIVILDTQNNKQVSNEGQLIPVLEKGLEIYLHKIEDRNPLEGLLKYSKKNDVEMLCIARTEYKYSLIRRMQNRTLVMSKMVRNIEKPLLIMGNN